MIKFGDFVEKFDKGEAGSIDKYRNIKPTETMSDTEVDDFWSAEFLKEDEEELDVYDKLLSEIFNRSEDELHIDFEIDKELQILLEKFKPESWSNFSEVDQMDNINALVKEVGKRLNLEKLPEVVWMEEDGSYGYFDPILNVISLNSRYLNDPVELVNTITHEVRHAFQNMRAKCMDTWEDALYRCNFENYINPVPLPGGGWLFFMDYLDQYVEVDARAFANKFTEAMT